MQHTRIVAVAVGGVLAGHQVSSSDRTNNELLGSRHDSISILHPRKLRHRKGSMLNMLVLQSRFKSRNSEVCFCSYPDV